VYIKKKKFYVLSKIENNTYHLFNLIKRDIPSSIFSSLNYKFFNSLIIEKIIHLYIIQYKKKNSAIITITTVRNLAKLKYTHNIMSYVPSISTSNGMGCISNDGNSQCLFSETGIVISGDLLTTPISATFSQTGLSTTNPNGLQVLSTIDMNGNDIT
jgi:hypothetical protein